MSETTSFGPIELVRGDITEMDTDAIVNPSNTSLVLGGGVSGAIRSKGGNSIQAEMDKIGGCGVGEAVVTGAGSLKARYVIHAVGPRAGEGGEDEKLRSATIEALNRAEELGVESVALPAISTGIFGFPLEKCASIMLTAALDHFSSDKAKRLKRIVFCLWGDEAFDVFSETLSRLKRERALPLR